MVKIKFFFWRFYESVMSGFSNVLKSLKCSFLKTARGKRRKNRIFFLADRIFRVLIFLPQKLVNTVKKFLRKNLEYEMYLSFIF